MLTFSGRLGFVLVLAALCLDGRTAHAQAGPIPYWIPGSPFGFGGALSGGQSLNTYANFPGFEGSDGGDRFSYTRYNLPNGWFVGHEGAALGVSMNGFNQLGAFGSSLRAEGTQLGYNFQNSPVTVYAGFDTLKYNSGIGSPFAPFDSNSGTLPGYSAHAGVEIRPTSNLSLSLGVGYTEQPGDINSLVLPGASPFTARR